MTIGTGLPINFSDVTTEIYGTSNTSGKTLNGAFSAANGAFNSTYSGSKNSLLNFRGYNHTPLPLAPSAPVLMTRTLNTLKITWSSGDISCNIYLNGVYVGSRSQSQDPVFGTFEFTITNLSPNTSYNVTVSQINLYGEGPQSAPLVVSTLAQPYTGTVQNFAMPGSGVEIVVKGKAVLAGGADAYFTFYEGDTIHVNVSGPSRLFLNISFGHTYSENKPVGPITYTIPSAPAADITFRGDGW